MGCGGGHASFTATCHVASVVAYDLSQDMLAVVGKGSVERGISNITTCQGYAESLPFADAKFDRVISRYSAHHWQDPGRALREVRRIVRPGGK